MKKLKRALCILLAAALLLGGAPTLAAWEDFTDISDHWSEEAMKTAYDYGLVNGYADNTIVPDRLVTKAETLALIVRVLAAQAEADMSGTGISEDEWYYQAVSQALALGIVELDELDGLDESLNREDVFILLGRAFQFVGAETDTGVLESFPDYADVSYGARASTAALVSLGYVEGTETGLNPIQGITRGELVTALGRIIGNYSLPYAVTGSMTGGISIPAVMVREDEAGTAGAAAGEAALLVTGSDAQTAAGRALPLQSAEDGEGEDAGESPDDGDRENGEGEPGAEITEYSPTVRLSDLDLSTYLLINSYAADIALSNVHSSAPVVIRSANLENLTVSGGSLDRLVLAAVEGGVTFAPEDGGAVDTFVAGSGSGVITLGDGIENVEVTGSGRTVYLQMESLNSLTISGTGNRVYISEGTRVDTATLVYGAEGNVLTVDGGVSDLAILGDSNGVVGSGHVENALVRGINSSVGPETGTLTEDVDYGLTGVDITLTPSNNPVPAGGGLQVAAGFSGVQGDAVVSAQWYENGSPVPGYSNSAFPLSADKTTSYSPVIEFTEDMDDTVTLGLELTYTRQGEPQRVYREITVSIENYPRDYYHPNPLEQMTWSESYDLIMSAEIIDEISPVYRGNYSLSYNKDYSVEAKEDFVNSNGYSSRSGILVWVNLGTQKTHIFTGSQGNWELKYSFVVATGAASSPTPTGVFTTWYNQSGWYTSSYTARPVVRFRPNTGYAFHSRLYYPGTNTLKDASIGYPVSAGCVRMYDSDIYWMYNNIPSDTSTTVVVY